MLNPADDAHQRAIAVTRSRHGNLVTTEWVLIEVADALASPDTRHRFLNLMHAIAEDPQTIIVPADSLTFQAGLELYRGRADKSWPLTDCISFRIMEQRGISEALTGDHHFSQAGFVPLLRSA